MDTKRFVIGTLVGGVIMYALGYLIFVLAFGDFYAANRGSASGVDREQQIVWAYALGCLSYAALVTLGIGSRAGSLNLAVGAKVGAIVGFLLWLTVNFILYGMTNIETLTRATIDPFLELVRGGIAGGVIGIVLGKVR
jgi:hypothetical protein